LEWNEFVVLADQIIAEAVPLIAGVRGVEAKNSPFRAENIYLRAKPSWYLPKTE
jgi:hypothetical protein